MYLPHTLCIHMHSYEKRTRVTIELINTFDQRAYYSTTTVDCICMRVYICRMICASAGVFKLPLNYYFLFLFVAKTRNKISSSVTGTPLKKARENILIFSPPRSKFCFTKNESKMYYQAIKKDFWSSKENWKIIPITPLANFYRGEKHWQHSINYSNNPPLFGYILHKFPCVYRII